MRRSIAIRPIENYIEDSKQLDAVRDIENQLYNAGVFIGISAYIGEITPKGIQPWWYRMRPFNLRTKPFARNEKLKIFDAPEAEQLRTACGVFASRIIPYTNTTVIYGDEFMKWGNRDYSRWCARILIRDFLNTQGISNDRLNKRIDQLYDRVKGLDAVQSYQGQIIYNPPMLLLLVVEALGRAGINSLTALIITVLGITAGAIFIHSKTTDNKKQSTAENTATTAETVAETPARQKYKVRSACSSVAGHNFIST